jgi:hypothetical protein
MEEAYRPLPKDVLISRLVIIPVDRGVVANQTVLRPDHVGLLILLVMEEAYRPLPKDVLTSLLVIIVVAVGAVVVGLLILRRELVRQLIGIVVVRILIVNQRVVLLLVHTPVLGEGVVVLRILSIKRVQLIIVHVVALLHM